MNTWRVTYLVPPHVRCLVPPHARVLKRTKKRFVWRTFYRQEDAFAFCDSCRTALHTFSYEVPGMDGGKRKFLVTTYETLASRYLKMPADKRHIYELIREGRPCKLYFDLEYARHDCPTLTAADDDALIETFITFTLQFLATEFPEHVLSVRPLPSSGKRKRSSSSDGGGSGSRGAGSSSGAGTAGSKTKRGTTGTVRGTATTTSVGVRATRSDLAASKSTATSLESSTAKSKISSSTTAKSKNSSSTTAKSGSGSMSRSSAKGKSSSSSSSTADEDAAVASPPTTSTDFHRQTILDLDSSTDEKFSRHLIFTSSRFQDNVQQGHFVEKLVDAIARSRDPALAQLQSSIVDAGGNPASFVDVGVYTRNRNFRLFLSSKINKNVVLKVAARNQHPCAKRVGSASGNEAAVVMTLMESLVCNVPFSADTNLLTATARPHGGSGGSSSSSSSGGGSQPSGQPGSSAPPLQKGYKASPYPAVDAFVVATASALGTVGNDAVSVRRWCYYEQAKVLTYDIHGNRYCHRVGRQHKSNGVMYVVNLLQGIFYQKCHDPDCRRAGFMSNDFPVPAHLLPARDGGGG